MHDSFKFCATMLFPAKQLQAAGCMHKNVAEKLLELAVDVLTTGQGPVVSTNSVSCGIAVKLLWQIGPSGCAVENCLSVAVGIYNNAGIVDAIIRPCALLTCFQSCLQKGHMYSTAPHPKEGEENDNLLFL